MKFIIFKHDRGEKKLGMYSKSMENIIDLGSIKLKGQYKNMKDLIENLKDEDIEKLKYIYNDSDYPKNSVYDKSNVTIAAPIGKTESDVICLGLNYIDHVKETAKSFKDDSIDIPEHPVYFSKRAVSPIGPGDFIDSHSDITNQLDYEVELAVIIGKEGTNIPKERAENHVFGYTIMNDISARDIQQKHVQWYRGKSLDTFTSFGPCVVYKDEIKFPVELNLCSRVNGELRQNSNTRNFIFDIPTIINELSSGMTLRPGDIIATGTPSGVGMGFNPSRFLKKGDIVECEVENIGTLRNKVI
ncbi:fumarylacetoacetate hydrolase family protein [uncultured Clostridium sp.]|uniref:fumarylacetoacetate hydrolase family protein n=1 Tax=uncultured Clostridium sp. TaxID=59620 RepID=UPI0025EEF3BF|nr:fumarylacetoacetate hydrolase family protein [uncultured Clostridium sp.]